LIVHGVCFQSIGQVAWQELEDPAIASENDAIVRVEMAALCGSDLHPFFGRETGLDPGTVMGHEFVGEVVATGKACANELPIGLRVCSPFSTSCGKCFYCLKGLTSRCLKNQLFGWRSDGYGLHGGQAEFVRVPNATGTLVPLGDRSPEIALLLGDNLSTGWYCAEMAAVGPEGVHVVIGCGTVGLLCILACRSRGVTSDNLLAFDPIPERAGQAARLGANAFSVAGDLEQHLLSVTEGRGADSVMELVGLPEAQQLAYRLIRPGGVMSVIGCHCTPEFAFGPADAYNKNLTYRTGRCPARFYMDRLDPMVKEFGPELASLITHRFSPVEAVRAYDVFSNRRNGCIKAVFDFSASTNQ
jgi:alcohol dehydrogenase